jgi:cytochrome b561
MWRDSEHSYGWVAILLHWVVAAGVIGLFALGVWMVGLTYYDPWYNRAPDWHRSIGMLLLGVLLLRFAWRLLVPRPAPEAGHRPWERVLGHAAHGLLNLLTLAVIVAGFLISSADGRPVAVFDWFSVPAAFDGFERQESVAGDWHRWLAYVLIGLAALHALAALKHHFVDRDRTLRRMLWPVRRDTPE